MPLVIALPQSTRPSTAAMHPHVSPRKVASSAASSRRSVSGRSVRSRTSQSTRTTATRSTAPSSVSASSVRTKTAPKRDTNITIRQGRGHKGIDIRVDNHTGNYADEIYSDESEELSDERFVSEDEEDYTSDEAEDSWDLIEDEIQPSDSASRPQHPGPRRHQSHHHAPPVPSAPSVPVAPRPRQSRRASSRHAVAAPDPHSAQHSRSRSRGPEVAAREQRPRRRRHQSAHQPPADSLGEEDPGDDYPGYPPQPPPGHPSAQWSHVQPAPGYAPSTMSQHYDPHFFHQGGAASPAGQLVGPGYYDPHRQNGFSPQQPNPFATGPDGYFGGPGARPGNPNRRSMGAPPSAAPDAMMPYGHAPPPPMGGHAGFPPGYPYPYPMSQMGYPPYSQHHSPPPEDRPRRSKRGTPRPQSSHYDDFSDDDHRQAPAPPPQPAPMPVAVIPQPPPPPPPPPPDHAKENAMLEKLNALLLGKEEEEKKKEAEARRTAELAKFDRLESLLMAQTEAQIAKDKAKKQAAEDAAKSAADAKKRGDEDKLASLEKLILAQKDEQLKREAAADAARKAAQEEADAQAKKIAEEKKAAAEAAALLLEAAKKAREEAEKKAAAEAEETKKAHEKALAEAKAAADELEKAKKAAEEEAAKLKPSDAPKAPIKFKDAVGRKFSFPWNLCKTWKVSCGQDASPLQTLT
jgi:hypothetical protein